MKLATLSASVLAAATLVVSVGCDNNDTPAPVKTDTTMQKASDSGVGGKTSAAVSGAAADMKASASGAMGDVKAGAADATDAVSTQASALYDKAMSAIQSAKWDDAQKYVDQLKGMRDKLPADWQTKVDSLVKMLADAKAKMPSMPALPGMPK